MSPELSKLEHRLDKLERQNRRYRWSVIGLTVLLIAGAPALVSAGDDSKAGETATTDRILTRSIGIVDASGAVRLDLSAEKAGTPALRLMDAGGETLATLTVTPSGTPMLALMAGGKTQAALVAPKDKGGHLVTFDKAGEKSGAFP